MDDNGMENVALRNDNGNVAFKYVFINCTYIIVLHVYHMIWAKWDKRLSKWKKNLYAT